MLTTDYSLVDGRLMDGRVGRPGLDGREPSVFQGRRQGVHRDAGAAGFPVQTQGRRRNGSNNTFNSICNTHTL